MSLQRMAWAACGILGLAWGATAQEKVKLEYKLQPGMELTYTISGTARSDEWKADGEHKFSGFARFIVADVLRPRTGLVRVGQLKELKFSAVGQTPQGAQNRERTLNTVSVCSLNRNGAGMVRKPSDEEHLARDTREMLSEFDRRELDSVILPADEVAEGASWENASDAPLGAFRDAPPLAAKVVSTLAGIKTVDGRKLALIKSKFTPSDKKVGDVMLEIAFSGEVETLFDLEGGFARSTTCKLETKEVKGGRPITASIDVTTVFYSQKTLPPDDLALEAKWIRAFDAAASAAYRGRFAEAAQTLSRLSTDGLTDATKDGINEAINTLNILERMPKVGPDKAAVHLYNDAVEAMNRQNTAYAIARFKEFVEKYPDHNLVANALEETIRTYEHQLNDKKSADEVRQQLIALWEKRAAADPKDFWQLAFTYTGAGETEKAISTYRKLLADPSPAILAGTRISAQETIGRLSEKLGKTAEAIEAYKAVADMPGDQWGSKDIKARAKSRLDALTAAAPK